MARQLLQFCGRRNGEICQISEKIKELKIEEREATQGRAKASKSYGWHIDRAIGIVSTMDIDGGDLDRPEALGECGRRGRKGYSRAWGILAGHRGLRMKGVAVSVSVSVSVRAMVVCAVDGRRRECPRIVHRSMLRIVRHGDWCSVAG